MVFAQNTTDVLKFYEFHVTNQPAGGKATFRQFEKPTQAVLDEIVVAIPRGSTVARTLYATSTDVNAQILVNIQEVTPIELPGTAGPGQPDPNAKKEYRVGAGGERPARIGSSQSGSHQSGDSRSG